MRALTSKVAVLVLPTALFACSRTAAAPARGYWVASDSSQYSPTVRLRVVTAWGGSNLTVVLDSGVIAVPGALSAESPPMMRDLYMVAYVAIPNTTPMGFVRDSRAQFADRRGWKVAAASDSIRVAGQLRFGEQRVIGSVQLRVNGAPRGEGSAWLVLGITGESLDLRIPFDESSGLRAGSPGKRRVQVYACSDRDLGGQLDTTRSNAMRRAYGAVC